MFERSKPNFQVNLFLAHWYHKFTAYFPISRILEFLQYLEIAGRFFIDRDGHLFRYILEYLRNECKLPNIFT
uniref:Potassium channel tetramerisation-type BTB domain-containing protein n=1 Tax=Tetranychus urticae TaxID=32264 RepID=T1L528_TETUR